MEREYGKKCNVSIMGRKGMGEYGKGMWEGKGMARKENTGRNGMWV